ncbi:hypothetical protein Acor_55650 [Acrocarpospora corrugata]|uniref:Zinc finger CGNR domain-containing protein n=1 Tax=Acrocarpospora corrugata TaxID=35763 RepID=A0A5M3W5C3_9ACTN|nr:CGNR zinc finger domain-containing protein [Acrocarpospora corrugata]GES03499.1 hypothetical protein Acor_55650 [Acrocarpospora corrugata]
MRTPDLADGPAGENKPHTGAGSLCLDFVAVHAEDDALDSPDLLGAWLAATGLPTPAGGLTSEDLQAARRLRASVEAASRARVAGEDADADDVRCVNTFAGHRTPVFLLRPGGRQRALVEEADLLGTLSVIARDTIQLLTGANPTRLRECARAGCGRLFYDRSPAGRRRWCAMKGCGEMVAAASYRQRRAEKVTPPTTG